MGNLTFEEKKQICIRLGNISANISLKELARHIANAMPQNIYESYGLISKDKTITIQDAEKSDDLMAFDKTEKGRLHIAQSIANDIIQYATITPELLICSILANNVCKVDIEKTLSKSRSIHAYAHNLLQFPYNRLKMEIPNALFAK